MVDRPQFGRSTRAAASIAILVLAAVAAGCGSQIPFGTPRPSGVTPPTARPSGATTAPSAGQSAGATVAPSAVPGSDAPGTAAPGSDGPLPTPPTTAVTYAVAGTTLRLTLPPGWVGYDSASSQAAVLAATREHPELTEAFDRLGSGRLMFVAVDASATGGDQPPSLTIGSIGGPIPSVVLLESLAATTADPIQQNQAVDGEIEQRTLDLTPGPGPAVNLRWHLEPVGEAEALGFDAYLLSVGDRTYQTTFAAPISVLEGFAPAFEAIVASMIG